MGLAILGSEFAFARRWMQLGASRAAPPAGRRA